jgi:hypothetical protein
MSDIASRISERLQALSRIDNWDLVDMSASDHDSLRKRNCSGSFRIYEKITSPSDGAGGISSR